MDKKNINIAAIPCVAVILSVLLILKSNPSLTGNINIQISNNAETLQ